MELQVVAPSTSRSTPALLAATLLLRPGSVRDPALSSSTRSRSSKHATDTAQSTGARRPSAGRPPVPAACATSRPSTASSPTASRRAPPPAPRAPRPPKCLAERQGEQVLTACKSPLGQAHDTVGVQQNGMHGMGRSVIPSVA